MKYLQSFRNDIYCSASPQNPCAGPAVVFTTLPIPYSRRLNLLQKPKRPIVVPHNSLTNTLCSSGGGLQAREKKYAVRIRYRAEVPGGPHAVVQCRGIAAEP